MPLINTFVRDSEPLKKKFGYPNKPKKSKILSVDEMMKKAEIEAEKITTDLELHEVTESRDTMLPSLQEKRTTECCKSNI